MSNETFEQLYKKFTGMINSFIKKYRGLLENDEIHQCCCLAIMKAYNTYNNHKDMKLSNLYEIEPPKHLFYLIEKHFAQF